MEALKIVFALLGIIVPIALTVICMSSVIGQMHKEAMNDKSMDNER